MKKLLSAAVLSGMFLLGAGEVRTLTEKDFTIEKSTSKNGEISTANGVITVKGKVQLMQNEAFQIDPAKTYVFSISCRSANGYSGAFMPIIIQYDAKGRTISCGQVKAFGGTFTELLAPVKYGDKTLLVKDAKLWNKKRLLCIAFNAKEDYSDLPSRFVSWNTITDVKEENGAFRVTLAKPIMFNAAANTGIRLHHNGPRMIYPLGGKAVNGSWYKLNGEISGQSRNDFLHNIWAPGAVSARLGILVNWNKPETITEIKDISIEIR